MGKIIQNITVAIGLIIVAALGYYLFVLDKEQPDSQGFSDVSVTSAQILQQLNTIRGISLETDLFTNQRFQTLRSYEPPVVPISIGNTKPFGQ